MDWPFYAFFSAIYNKRLDYTNPPETYLNDYKYIPAFVSKPFGLGWNRRWYHEVAKQSGVAEKKYIKNHPPRKVPANCNNCSNDLEMVRKISHGLIALDNNFTRIKAYRDFLLEEGNCLNICKAIPGISEFQGEKDRCERGCKFPKLLMFRDLQAELDLWKEETLECMGRHGVNGGDGNAQAFDQCVNEFGEKIVRHATEEVRLKGFMDKYNKMFFTGGKTENWLGSSKDKAKA